MTNRPQILRSSTPGQVPAAGSRLPGELWTTFPDLQLGVIDASKNAQKLIAVRFFSTAANYAAGDFVIQAGVLYVAKGAVTAGVFNSTQWTKVAAATDLGGPYLPIAGGTLTGALTLNADPGAALGAATKQYVDGKMTAAPFLPLAGGTLTGPVVLSGSPTIPLHAATKAYVDAGAFVPIAGGTMTGDLILNRDAQVALGAATKEQVDARGAGDNRIINGDMRIDQRNNGASGTAAGYTVDRWQYSSNLAGKGQWQQGHNGPVGPSGFPYNLSFKSLSAYTSAASDYFMLTQPIEADMVSDFAWGSAAAQAVTLSFWAYSTVSGAYSGAIGNAAGTRTYPFSYSIPTINTWTRIVVIIPGDTTGAWVLSGNASAGYVSFDLGCGSTYRGSANAWASASYYGATGAVSVVATNAATFYVTGVKLEIGSVATPFNRQSLAKSMADCQRYYFLNNGIFFAVYAAAGANFSQSVILPVTMRASPTIAFVGPSYSNASGIGSFIISPNSTAIYATATAANTASWQAGFTASAEL